jgi:hypothetical protein
MTTTQCALVLTMTTTTAVTLSSACRPHCRPALAASLALAPLKDVCMYICMCMYVVRVHMLYVGGIPTRHLGANKEYAS